jgi:hypothetical protein
LKIYGIERSGNEEALKVIETFQLLLHADDVELVGGNIRALSEK